MQAQPQNDHQWLQQLVGEWTYEHECSIEPDKPSEKFTGTETVRWLGGLWVVCEGQGEMPGCAGTMIMTLGYDPAKKKYVGTWVGSMMTHMFIYEGELDSAGKVLTLDCEGPSFNDERKMAKYQDIIEIRGPDHRVLRSRTPGEDGEWQEFMTAHFRRVK